MIIVNFAHPMTPAQVEQIERLSDRKVERIIDVPVQIDLTSPMAPQVVEIVEWTSLSPTEWQTLPILVNLPSLNFVAGAVLAELHGRMGYFPPIVALRRTNTTPPAFEVAEVVSLQALRDHARARRS